MCPMWVFTVPSLMKSVEPISALLAPRPISGEDVALPVGELGEPGGGLRAGERRGAVGVEHRARHRRVEPGAAGADGAGGADQVLARARP